MANDKYSMGGKYAPHRYNTGNHDYNPITSNGPSLGCISTVLAVLTIVIWYAITYVF